MRNFLIWIAWFVLLLTFSGCSNSGSTSSVQGKVFRYALTAEPTTLDPARVEDGPTIDLLFQVYEGLVRWEVGNELVPNIAERWEISPDGKTYTFYLKKGVKFHNGREVTAEDFKYSIERSLDPETGSTTAGTYLNDIVGANERLQGKTQEVAGVQVVDSHTLQIEIDAPKAYFLAKLTYPTAYAVCKEAIEKTNGKVTVESAIGTGPFKWKEYVANSKVVLEAFGDYHDGRPLLDFMERPIILDATTRHAMYESGELDLCDVQKSDLIQDQKDPVLSKELQFFDRAAVYYFALNQNAYAPFKDMRVRQAFALAIDREEAVRVALQGVNKKANGILPPGVPGYDESYQGWSYDPKRAAELLAEAGYPGGKGMPKLTLTFREKTPDLRRVAEVAANMLKQNLGMDVDLREMEWGAFLDELNKESMPMYHLRWAADYLDPQNFLSVMLRTGAQENRVGYSNPKFDALCDEADRTTDSERRIQLYRQAEKLVVEEAPWVPIYYQKDVELIKPYVSGVRDTLLGHLPHAKTDVAR